MNQGNVYAVLLGTGVGVAVALLQREGARESPPPLPPAAAQPFPSERERRAEVAARPETSVSPDPSAVESATSHGVPTPLEEPIASQQELGAAVLACEKRDAGACRRAALAAENGTVAPKDLALAKRLRRIELTLIVRACEKSSVEACLALADRYARGDGLARNERTARALHEHVRTLCARRPEPACPRQAEKPELSSPYAPGVPPPR